jgi:hypothetical protein
MKKVILLVIAIILITASQAIAQYKYRGSGNGVITSTDCSTYTAIGQLCQDTDDGILYKGTGSAVEVVYSSTSALSADIQTLLGSDSYATARTNLGLAIGTNVQEYNQYYMKKAAAAFTEGHLVKTDANGDLVSAGAPIDLTSTITQNVETSGYLSGKMRAVIVAVPSGVHDGSNDQALMTDGGIDLGADTLIGMTVYNVTDGSSCTITDNAATTITCTLAGGTGNDWDTNDVWQVGPGPAQSGSVFYVGSAGTIRHPATVGYLAGYYTTAAAAVIINPASDSMVIKNATASAIDAGDSIDSPATAGSYIFLHNASATLAYTLGKNGTYTDGGAD